ncbi:MAG TPA: PAS domain S-box protein [Longimicrobiales bacterium]|nr:PAS domain S-box protein [Longimicrobiales bacterium]
MKGAYPHEEAGFRAVARTLADAVLVMDGGGRILFTNGEVEPIFGYRPEELVGESADRLFEEGGQDAHHAALARVGSDPESPAMLDRIRIGGVRKDGGAVPLEVTYGAYAKDGTRFYTGVVRDLSEEHRTESRLRFQSRLLDAVGEAVIATDPAGRILYWNAGAERLYGWGSKEVIGEVIDEVTPAGVSRSQATAIMDRLREGESWTGEFLVRDRDGREFPVAVTDSPVFDEDGAIVGIIGTSKEISTRKRAEDAQRFLAEAGRVLSSSLDLQTTLSRVSRLAVPTLGEWCFVHLFETGKDPAPVAHCTPAGEEDEASELESIMAVPGGVLASVLPSPEPVALAPGHPALSADARSRLEALDIRELLVVPLEVRDAPLGVMTFARPARSRPYDEEDARLAAELALRAASAIDNARLYRDREESDRAKTDFLAVVSHELRTPLNAITGYAELLVGGISGPLNETQQNQIERIRVSAGHLAQLIDEILTFARMEGGRETVEPERVDAAQIVREAAMVLQPAARAKELPLTVDVPAGAVEIFTDPGKLRQIVVNLLSNAVKYTDAGMVEVTLRATADGIELTVSDTGIGIPPEEQERIFEPFRQVQSPNTRTTGGTGLGLSVSRRLAHVLGGRISLQSAPDEGSTFTVQIPSRPASTAG